MTVPVPQPFGELDAVLALAIEREEQRGTLRGVDAIAVRAIVALSHAGAELMTDASHAGVRDVERLSTRARQQLDRARELMADLSATRELDEPAAGPGANWAGEPHVFNASDPEVDLCDECGLPRGAHS